MKKDMLSRFAYIETRLYWSDGLTAGNLAKAFRLARQNAQGVIADYRRRHPDNMFFDAKRKRQVMTPTFSPHYISTSPAAFLPYQRGVAMSSY